MNAEEIDAQALQQALAPLPLGPIRFHRQVGSTNDLAMAWVAAGAPDLSVVVAEEQTAGRGRAGRRWYTPPGAALALSVILRPPRGGPPGLAPRVTALGALAVSEAVRDGWGLDARLKWPNDVLVHGRKIAGVLAEATWQGDRLQAVILGIGVNVTPRAVPPPEAVQFPVASLEEVVDDRVDRLALLQAVLRGVLDWRPRLHEPAFIARWQERLAYLGERVEVTPPEGPAHIGRLRGLDEHGGLILASENGEIRTFHTGDVRQMRPVDREAK